MKRLVVVADNSLIVEAIAIGLRSSGEFSVDSHIDGGSATSQAIIDAQPDVVLIDDMEQSHRVVELIRETKAGREEIAIIVLTMAMDPKWLDEVFDAGAAGAISKATHPVALTTLVRETLNGNVLHAHRSPGRTRVARLRPAPVEGFPLTPRELEVLQLVASGANNGEIAQRLWVTEQTVKFHLSNVYRKLDVGNRTEASHYAHVNGLVVTPLPAKAADTSG